MSKKMTLIAEDTLNRIRERNKDKIQTVKPLLPIHTVQINSNSHTNVKNLLLKLRQQTEISKACSFSYTEDENTFVLDCTGWNERNSYSMLSEISYRLGGAKIEIKFGYETIHNGKNGTFYIFVLPNIKDCVWFKLTFHDLYMRYQANA